MACIIQGIETPPSLVKTRLRTSVPRRGRLCFRVKVAGTGFASLGSSRCNCSHLLRLSAREVTPRETFDSPEVVDEIDTREKKEAEARPDLWAILHPLFRTARAAVPKLACSPPKHLLSFTSSRTKTWLCYIDGLTIMDGNLLYCQKTMAHT